MWQYIHILYKLKHYTIRVIYYKITHYFFILGLDGIFFSEKAISVESLTN